MEKMRIISENITDTATITADTTAGSLIASNMSKNKKSAVWRSTSPTATITVTGIQKPVNGVVAAFTNCSPGALMRVRAYAVTTDSTPIYDSSQIFGNPPAPLGSFTWGDTLGENAYSGLLPLGVNNFSRGRYSYLRVWFNTTVVAQKIVIDIDDTASNNTYIEIGRLIIGKSWSPETGTEFGATTTSSEDSSTNVRSEAGDLVVNSGTISRSMAVNLPAMQQKDMDIVWKILRDSSTTKPILISVFPNNANTNQEQTFMMYGSLSSPSTLGIPFYNRFDTEFKIEEI